MNKIKKRRRVLAVMSLICILLSGCGRRQVEFGDEENNIGEIKSGLADVLGIDERIWETEFVVQDESVQSVKINAPLEFPDVDHMSVISLKQKVFAAEEKKALAENLLDGGSIYVHDKDKLPLWYIESRLSELRGILNSFEYNKEDPSYPWTEEDDRAYETQKEERDALEALKREATSEGVLPSDYSERLFLGESEGIHYVLGFDEPGVFYRAANPASFMHGKELLQNGTIYCYGGSVPAGRNLCTMKEEKAKNLAMDFVNRMGLSGYTVSDIQPLKWIQYDIQNYEEWMDGYEVVLVRNINGVELTYRDYSDLIVEYMRGHNPSAVSWVGKYGQERICIDINDAGVYECDLMYPYELGDTLSESTTMLSYESVKSRIQSIIEAEPNPYCRTVGSGPMLYTKLNLEYMRIESDGEYALVPVWQLMGMKNGSIYYLVCINAIDGSEINVAEEFAYIDEVQ
ncbi:MAG: hypothetical protein K2G89_01535 [Lachnospiraceae bacterium]|nr:hypothetical protein [Lachnospiraceae bacterium]